MKEIKLLLRPVAVTLFVQSLFMTLCAGIAFWYGENYSARAFLLTVAIVLVSGILMFLISSNRGGTNTNISMRAGFILVVLIWAVVSLAGALPLMLSGAVPKFADALFESVSGFTTVGATVLSGLDNMPRSINLWRALMHWLGGGGIIVLSVAILPLLGIGGMQMMKAEASMVKMEKATPRIAQTAKYLWIFYFSTTMLFVALLTYFGGMELFDSFCISFAAISTGGFAPHDASISFYGSAIVDWLLVAEMLIGGMSFVLLIRFLRGDFSSIFYNSEFKAYITIFTGATFITAMFLYGAPHETWAETFRFSAFQVASILTTTGFATQDYTLWTMGAQAVIFVLFFIGGSTGSTAGGVKVARCVILIRQAINELKTHVHPHGVFLVRLNAKALENTIIKGVMGFFILYVLVILVVTFLISALSDLDILSSFTGTLATLGTVGPGFGRLGPSFNYGFLPDSCKYIYIFSMLLGRLELYTLLVIFTPWFWRR